MVDLANEYKYLKNLTTSGTKGQAAWARSQAQKYGLDLTKEYQPATSKTTTPKPTIQPSNRISASALNQARNDHYRTTGTNSVVGSQSLNPTQLNSVASYNQRIQDLRKKAQDLVNQQVAQGHGVLDSWSKQNLAPIYGQIYSIQDYLTKNYGLNGWNDNHTLPGISRAETGHNMTDYNGFRMFDTPQEWDAQQRLIKQGISPQKAYEMVRGIDHKTVYSPTNPFTANGNAPINMSLANLNQSSTPSIQGTFKTEGVNAMPTLSPIDAENKILQLKRQYEQAKMNHASQSELDAIHQQAEQIRQQSGLDNSRFGADVTLNDANKNFMNDQTSNMYNQINNLYDQLQQAQISQLRASQQAAIKKLNQQQAEFGQQIQGQKNQASVNSAQAAERLRELMAANGISASGENVTANVALQNARQSAMNALDMQQNNFDRGIANQISDVNNPLQEQSILAQLNAQRAQALIDAQNTAWNQNFQQQQMDWQQYVYNHLSAADKAQLDWAQKQFGEQMGWNYWAAQNQNAVAQAQAQAQIDAYKQMLASLGNFNQASGGGDYNNYKMMPQAQKNPNFRNFVQDLTSAMKKTGAPESWFTPLAELVGRESSWNPNAKNPNSSAHGYAQFLDSTVKNYSKYGNYNNPVDQLVMMIHYIKDRYGTPQDALKFWDANRYY